jgi:hypothetical protein
MSEENDWKQSLPEPLRDAPFFAKATSVDAVLADIKNAAQHMGNSIRIPGPDASAEDRAAFRKKAAERIGELMEVPNPDDEEGYKTVLKKLGALEKAEDYPSFDGEVSDDLRQLAAEAGMTKKQYEAFFGKLTASQKEAVLAQQAAQQEAIAPLKAEWGAAFDKRIADTADILLKAGAPEQVIQGLSTQTMTPDAIKWLYDVGQKLAPPGSVIAAQGKTPDASALTPAEIQAQITDIQRNADYRDTRSPNQKYLVQKMVKLQEMLQ